ncbi:ATP-binding protein [Chitinibacter sp. FCG-7]|uniref:histidine kinase n=1 Tax=Chitinibacter mangrovi TaxID=3153927 RepID=A0AAU7FDD1_9NEIS
MSLRLRLLIILSLSLTLLWGGASTWMMLELRKELNQTLDKHLVSSAKLVAGIATEFARNTSPSASTNILNVLTQEGLACEVSLLRGKVIARTATSPPEIAQPKTGYHTQIIDGQAWRSYTLEHDGLRITTADRISTRHTLQNGMILAAAIPFLIAVLGSLIALWLGIRQGLAPLESIRRALSQRNPASGQKLPETAVPSELKPLIATMNGLLERIQHLIARERSFTGNAAHELRSPLTAIKTHLQVARLAHDQEQDVALGHAEEGVARMQNMLNQLLTLAQVEGSDTATQENDSSTSTVCDLVMQMIPANERKRISIVDASKSAQLAIPSALAATALRNLVDNALRYSAGAVLLHLSADQERVTFRVEDEGSGMSELERQQAVQRFWRSGKGQGSGLGLSIVEAITQRYHGQFQLLEREEGGLIAQLSFPRNSVQ